MGGTFATGYETFDETAEDYDDIRADVTDNANRQAKAVARDKNKHEWTCTLKLVGNPRLVAGVTFGLTGFGVYSGKYIVDKAEHKLGNEYTTTIEGHKVLSGY